MAPLLTTPKRERTPNLGTLRDAGSRTVPEVMFPACSADEAPPMFKSALRYVYFIEAVGLNRVKIGIANDPRKRLATLQVGSPVELRLLSVLKVDLAPEWERDFHKRFAQHRLHGEWFELAPGVAAAANGGMQPEDKVAFLKDWSLPQPVVAVERQRGESANSMLRRLKAECERVGYDGIDWAR